MMTLGCPPMTISLEMKVMKKWEILEMRAMKVRSHRENDGDLRKCVFHRNTTQSCNDSELRWLCTLPLQGAFERRIDRQRAKREWEARRWDVSPEMEGFLNKKLNCFVLFICCCFFRSEILLDYEQYEYHGTSVSRHFRLAVWGESVRWLCSTLA